MNAIKDTLKWNEFWLRLWKMNEDRNFRYGYYEKVGFRGVEEKKSLDILLREKPIDLLSKLSQFTSRFLLPGLYRKLVWKFLLNVCTPDCEHDDFLIQEQRALCHDLTRALNVMLLTDESTSSSKLLVLMYFLELGQLELDVHKQVYFQRCQYFFLPFYKFFSLQKYSFLKVKPWTSFQLEKLFAINLFVKKSIIALKKHIGFLGI